VNIKTRDGIDLFFRDWPLTPGVTRRGAALLVHGTGEHIGRYAHVAEALNRAGIHVRGYDHRGFGQSGGPRATIPSLNALLDDAKEVFDAFAKAADAAGDAQPPFLIGHSMGGAIAARTATGGWIKPRGLVLSSPALKTWLRGRRRALVRVLNLLAPSVVRPHGLPLHMISRDKNVVEAAKADAYCHSLTTPRLVTFIVDAGRRARQEAAKLDVPTLLLVSGTDRLVDPEGSREFCKAMREGLCTFKFYPALYHEIFNETEPDRTAVLRDLSDWIEQQTRVGSR
jgi:alpha-beta hydrolase superfamily lysophospholipase